MLQLMNPIAAMTPVLADYIWIGGGTLALILVVIAVVALLRR